MSSERLQELGVPRRAFLKRAGAAALAAPLIVSFGLDAVAEGAGQSQPNQCFANQAFPNQTQDFPPVFSILRTASDLVYLNSRGQVKPPLNVSELQAIANLSVDALLLEAGGKSLQAYREWTQFIHEVNANSNNIPQQYKEELIADAQVAQESLDCN